MNNTLIRSAILAARRNLEDGKGDDADHCQDVRDAHYSISDTMPREGTEEEKREVQDAADLVADLLAFAAAIRGEMPRAPYFTPTWARKKDL